MIYYSTGKSSYLPARGKAVECTNATTVDILLKKGSLVVSLSDLEIIEVKEPKQVIEEVIPKRKGNPNWAKK